MLFNREPKTFSSAPILEQLGLIPAQPKPSKLIAIRGPAAPRAAPVREVRGVTPEQPDTKFIVFTDGSSIGNGRRDARAGFATYWPAMPELNAAGHIPGGTNNQAEFTAAVRALEAANTADPEGHETLYVYTDSMLLINTVTKWLNGWRKAGWRKRDGSEVLNLDLVKRLDALTQRRRVIWTHVSAHTGRADWMSKYNDIVDQKARAAAISKGDPQGTMGPNKSRAFAPGMPKFAA